MCVLNMNLSFNKSHEHFPVFIYILCVCARFFWEDDSGRYITTRNVHVSNHRGSRRRGKPTSKVWLGRIFCWSDVGPFPVFESPLFWTIDIYRLLYLGRMFFCFLGGFCLYSLFTIVSGRNLSGKKHVLTIYVAKVLKTKKRQESEIIFWKFIRQSRVGWLLQTLFFGGYKELQ